MSDIDVRFLHFSDGSLDVINQHQQQHLWNLPQKGLKEEEIWFYWVEFVLSGMSFLKPDSVRSRDFFLRWKSHLWLRIFLCYDHCFILCYNKNIVFSLSQHSFTSLCDRLVNSVLIECPLILIIVIITAIFNF